MSMTEEELLKQIARLLAMRFVYEHDTNTYPFNFDGLSGAGQERALKDATQIFRLVKQAGYVQLDSDQSLPDISETAMTFLASEPRILCRQVQQDMLSANFKKIRREVG